MRNLLAGPLLALLIVGAAQAYNLKAPLMPDPVRTPGDVLTSDPAVICVVGYSATVRNVPQAVKNLIYRQYGITSREAQEYEIDHLISLQLGGSNSVKNLWPQSYKTQPINAIVKDKLENRLRRLACDGKISFPQAQQAIAKDWRAAYVKYIGPLPGGLTPVTSAGNTVTVPALPITAPAAAASTPPNTDGSCPAAAPIKGSKSKIYHLPQGDGNYNRTRAAQCFADVAAAQAAGYRASR